MRKNGRPTKMTDELADDIAQRIRLGVYPYIAAESCGVGRTTFYRWLQQGHGSNAKKRFREFRDKVRTAAAHARVIAETSVYRDNPAVWLRSGPGREEWGDKGLTLTIKQEEEAPVPAIPNVSNFGQALAEMEAMGLIAITEAGKAAFFVEEEEEVEEE